MADFRLAKLTLHQALEAFESAAEMHPRLQTLARALEEELAATLEYPIEAAAHIKKLIEHASSHGAVCSFNNVINTAFYTRDVNKFTMTSRRGTFSFEVDSRCQEGFNDVFNTVMKDCPVQFSITQQFDYGKAPRVYHVDGLDEKLPHQVQERLAQYDWHYADGTLFQNGYFASSVDRLYDMEMLKVFLNFSGVEYKNISEADILECGTNSIKRYINCSENNLKHGNFGSGSEKVLSASNSIYLEYDREMNKVFLHELVQPKKAEHCSLILPANKVRAAYDSLSAIMASRGSYMLPEEVICLVKRASLHLRNLGISCKLVSSL